MNWDQPRIYVGSMVTCNPAKHQRHRVGIESQRHTTFKYHFRVDGVLIPVCKKFFLVTLNMKEWSVKDLSKKAAATNTSNPVQKNQITKTITWE